MSQLDVIRVAKKTHFWVVQAATDVIAHQHAFGAVHDLFCVNLNGFILMGL